MEDMYFTYFTCILQFLFFMHVEMIKQEAESSGLPLTPSYNTTRGFYIQINTKGQEGLAKQLPSNLVKVVKTKNIISCTTEDLVGFCDYTTFSVGRFYLLFIHWIIQLVCFCMFGICFIVKQIKSEIKCILLHLLFSLLCFF